MSKILKSIFLLVRDVIIKGTLVKLMACERPFLVKEVPYEDNY